MNNIRQNQVLRKKLKEKKKKQEKRMLITLGLVTSISLSIALISLSHSNNVNADTAQILQSQKNQGIRNNIDQKYLDLYETQKDIILEEKNQNYTNENKSEFYNFTIAYKKVTEESEVLDVISNDAKVLYTVKPLQYLEFMGEKDGWSKVSYKDIVGYVKSSVLEDTKDNELKVVNGVLIATKDYIIPKDFHSRFNPEVENAMMVMFEAMRREGLEMGVSRKYIESDEIIPENSDLTYPFPNIEQHELRTGKSLEFDIPNSPTAVDFGQTLQGKWIKNNAHKFGFVQRYPKSKESVTGFVSNDRIYSYVGSEIATKMVENNLTIEEYFK